MDGEMEVLWMYIEINSETSKAATSFRDHLILISCSFSLSSSGLNFLTCTLCGGEMV